MKFIVNSLIATSVVLLILQAGIISALFESGFKHSGSTNHSRFNNYSTIYNYNNTQHRPNNTAGVNNSTNKRPFHLRTDNRDELIQGADRWKRDIRNDFLENELQVVVKTYNSEITSQVESAVNLILSRSDGLNGLRKLLTFSFNNLATNGLNDLSSVASRLPTAIRNCYSLYGFKFSDAISVAKLTAGQCLSNKIGEAKSIVQDFRNSISNAVANLKDVAEQAAQCQIFVNSYPSVAGLIAKASCLNIAIFSIRGETVLLPLKFATLVAQAFNSILTIQSDMNRCGLEIINTILEQSIQSGRAINNCINEQNGAANTDSNNMTYTSTTPLPSTTNNAK